MESKARRPRPSVSVDVVTFSRLVQHRLTFCVTVGRRTFREDTARSSCLLPRPLSDLGRCTDHAPLPAFLASPGNAVREYARLAARDLDPSP